MSIVQMISADENGNYPEGAYSDIRWSRGESSNPNKLNIVMLETHVGLVIATSERNMRDDSDFYAIVWNDEKGQPEEITYASTRGWTYPNYAVVDAPPHVVKKYDDYYRARREADRCARTACDAATPDKGKTVEVVAGQKLPVGTRGVVGWYGRDRFDTYRGPSLESVGIYSREGRKRGFRVGLRVEGRSDLVFLKAEHVNVVPQVLTPA